MNTTRAYMDRAVVPGTGGTVVMSGEGFAPNETVNLSGCATASAPADDNGAVAFFLGFGAGADGVGSCVYTGATSGRVARSSVADPSAASDSRSGRDVISGRRASESPAQCERDERSDGNQLTGHAAGRCCRLRVSLRPPACERARRGLHRRPVAGDHVHGCRRPRRRHPGQPGDSGTALGSVRGRLGCRGDCAALRSRDAATSSASASASAASTATTAASSATATAAASAATATTATSSASATSPVPRPARARAATRCCEAEDPATALLCRQGPPGAFQARRTRDSPESEAGRGQAPRLPGQARGRAPLER